MKALKFNKLVEILLSFVVWIQRYTEPLITWTTEWDVRISGDLKERQQGKSLMCNKCMSEK